MSIAHSFPPERSICNALLFIANIICMLTVRNREALSRGAKTLNMLGKAMGEEIESQNRHITRITNKTDKVDDQIAVNRARLDRIR